MSHDNVEAVKEIFMVLGMGITGLVALILVLVAITWLHEQYKNISDSAKFKSKNLSLQIQLKSKDQIIANREEEIETLEETIEELEQKLEKFQGAPYR